MKDYIIIAPQEYSSSNHIELWKEMARQVNGRVIIMDIPADLIVTPIKHKTYRIREATSCGEKISENLYRMRVLFPVRPEITTFPGSFVYRKLFWRRLLREFPEIMQEEVFLLIYSPIWARILIGSHPNMTLGYYLIDEVRYEENRTDINKKNYKADEYACRNCDFILTMTDLLAESRKEYNQNVMVVGNGAVVAVNREKKVCSFKNSVCFIGNFRNWIDVPLLNSLIRLRQDLRFFFVGPHNPDMTDIFNEILNDNLNTFYLGCISKNKILEVYSLFDCIIVPYKQNDFMQNTRPIKIVESVCCGTPVVTIPMRGYTETSFIRFATDVDTFSKQIDYLINHPININSDEFLQFIDNNSWREKAKVILDAFAKNSKYTVV